MTFLASADDVVTMRVGTQWFGIPVLGVQEVLARSTVARVPLASPEVAGFINLRGNIVTAIDLRILLKIRGVPADHQMNVVVHDGDELFALLVDEAGDVVSVSEGSLETPPASLDATWTRSCRGLVRMDEGLLAILDVARLLEDSSNRL